MKYEYGCKDSEKRPKYKINIDFFISEMQPIFGEAKVTNINRVDKTSARFFCSKKMLPILQSCEK